MFLYADGKIQWGNNVLAGINAGNGIDSITIPGSRTPSIIGISRTSNVGILGVWLMKVIYIMQLVTYYNVRII